MGPTPMLLQSGFPSPVPKWTCSRSFSQQEDNNDNRAAPAATSKSSVGSTFGAYDQSGWGASSTSMGLNGSMSMPPPQEPTLTFGGEDGELSLGDDSRPPAAAPWNPDNPWG